MQQFQVEVQNFISLFEKNLKDFLNFRLKNSPKMLADSIRYSTLSPGKRIRPQISFLTGRILNVPQELTLAAATCIELYHTSTLIHDDLPCMDNDDFRRGHPSNHKKFNEATALLAGNELIFLALQALHQIPSLSATSLKTAEEFLFNIFGSSGVIGGQAYEFELACPQNAQQLNWIHEHKTASLFIAAAVLPYLLQGGEANEPVGIALYQIFSKFGHAFQLKDDIHDASDNKPILEKMNMHHFYSVQEIQDQIEKLLNEAVHIFKENFQNQPFYFDFIFEQLRQ